MPRKSPAKPAKASSRRSPCPVACGLDLFGDKWTLLIIRDLVLGRSRFKDFIESPEGIPTNILSDRLERLRDGGKPLCLVKPRIAAADGSKRLSYELTDKGLALRPVLRSIRDWGLKWEPGTSASLGTA